MTAFFRILFALFLVSVFQTGVLAHEVVKGDLTINHPVIPATVKAAPVAAGYLEIINNGEEADRLISVSAEFSGKSEIHTMKMEDGVMKMRPLKDGITINPGETVALEKGGKHLMFMMLSEPMEIGQMRKATLVFEKAGAVVVDLLVVDPADLGEKETDHSGHTH